MQRYNDWRKVMVAAGRSGVVRHEDGIDAGPMLDAILRFPARLPTPDEQALVAEWLAHAGDIAAAYVSNRRGDDPAQYRRIVIVAKPDEGPSHLVHAPSGRKEWIVFSLGRKSQIQSFPNLRDALNYIRPVLADETVKAAPGKPEAV
jgi:hypothetical protein